MSCEEVVLVCGEVITDNIRKVPLAEDLTFSVSVGYLRCKAQPISNSIGSEFLKLGIVKNTPAFL